MGSPISKITVAKVYGKIKTEAIKIGGETKLRLKQETPLMRVFGQTTGFRVATSQYGDAAVFKGIFKGINLETGEEFTAGECCLPKILEAQLSGILEDADGAEFGFDILAVPSTNQYGYEYKVKALLEVADAPALTSLEEKINAHAHARLPSFGSDRKALPMPTVTAKEKAAASPDAKKSKTKPAGKKK